MCPKMRLVSVAATSVMRPRSWPYKVSHVQAQRCGLALGFGIEPLRSALVRRGLCRGAMYTG